MDEYPNRRCNSNSLVGVAGAVWLFRQRVSVQRPWLWVSRGLVGGFSSSLLFLAFGYTDAFRVVLYSLVLVIV